PRRGRDAPRARHVAVPGTARAGRPLPGGGRGAPRRLPAAPRGRARDLSPTEGRLEREGLVETYRAASNGGPPRKYYRPSSSGRLALAVGVSEWRAARDAVDAALAPVKAEVTS